MRTCSSREDPSLNKIDKTWHLLFARSICTEALCLTPFNVNRTRPAPPGKLPMETLALRVPTNSVDGRKLREWPCRIRLFELLSLGLRLCSALQPALGCLHSSNKSAQASLVWSLCHDCPSLLRLIMLWQLQLQLRWAVFNLGSHSSSSAKSHIRLAWRHTPRRPVQVCDVSAASFQRPSLAAR